MGQTTQQQSQEGLSASPVEAGGTLRDWFVVALLLAASLVSFIDRFVMALLLEPIKEHMQLSDAHLGLLTGAAFGLFYAAMSLPMGWLADRWSRKGTINLGIAIWGLATAASGYAANAVQFALGRIFVGAGEAALAPSAYGIIHDSFPKQKLSRAMSVYQMGGTFGSGIALIITGAVYNYFLNYSGPPFPFIGHLVPWQQTFVFLALPCLPIFILIGLMREPRRKASATDMVSDKDTGNLFSAIKSSPKFFSSTFFGIAAIILIVYALLTWMPTMLIREHGWETVKVGNIYGLVVMITSATGLFFGGSIADAMTRRNTEHLHLKLSLIVAVLCLVLSVAIGFSTTAVSLLTIAGLLHFVISTPVGIIPAYVQLISPAKLRGQLSAVYVIVVNLIGIAVGPTAIGFVSSLREGEPNGLRLAVAIICAVSALAAIVLLWIALKDRQKNQSIARR